MTFVCLDHGAPSYWMPLRLSHWWQYCARPRLVRSVVFIILFLGYNIVTSEAGVSSVAKSHWIPMANLKRCNQSSSSFPPPDNSQCLQVDSERTRTICNKSTATRVPKMRGMRLKYCNSYPVFHVLNSTCQKLDQLSEAECVECLDNVEELDAQVYAIFTDFEDIMSRYDCETDFSSRWTCSDCKVAYRGWLCSTAIRYLIDGQEVPPCRTYCEEVERRCPYLLPQKDNQYAGEPSFLCTDSVMEYQSLVKRRVEGRCYKPCNGGVHDDDGVCVNNDTPDSTATTTSHTNSEKNNQNTSTTQHGGEARTIMSRSQATRLLATTPSSSSCTLTQWVGLATQLISIFWCSRTLSQHWVIGLT